MSGIGNIFKNIYAMKFNIMIFILAFLFFFAFYFPDERFLRIIFSSVSKQTGMNITPNEPEMMYFPALGVKFKSARITSADEKSKTELGESSLGVSLASIITFSPAMEINSKSFQGDINAKILGIPINPKRSLDELYLDIDSKGIRLDELVKNQPIDVNAIVDLAVQGTLNLINPAYSDIDITSSLSKIQIKEGNIMGFPIPNVFIKNGEIAVAVKKGEILIAKLNLGAPNDDLNLSIKGKISLKTNNPYDLSIKLKVAGDLAQQFGQFLTMLPAQAKNSEGFYNIRVRGDKRSPIPQIIPIQ
jgi:type II secretion system protein N